MKEIFTKLALLGVLIFATQVDASIRLPVGNGQVVELYSKSYALVVGVSDYEVWPDLPGVQEDIRLVGNSLKQHGFKVVTVLNPTRETFDRSIREFIGKYGQDPENRLVVYYAGHGHTLKTFRGRQLGYIVPSDAPLPNKNSGEFKQKAISMLEVEIFAKQMESKHALFMFDSCFSGSLFEISRAVPDSISQKTAEPVRQFITAGNAEQSVPDKSVFRQQFISGLDGDADLNTDGFITGTELAQYIEETVINYTRRAQTPQYGKIRDPILDKGDFIFLSPKVEITITPIVNSGASAQDNSLSVEIAFWNAVKQSGSAATYRAYLKKYPNGKFAELAEILMAEIVAQESNDTLAAIAPNVISNTRRKVVVSAWGDNGGNNTQVSDAVYSDYFASAMKEIVENRNLGNVALLNWKIAKDVNFASNEVTMSHRLCKENDADVLLFGVMSAEGSGGARRHPDIFFMMFDCSGDKMEYTSTSLDHDIRDPDNFIFKTSIQQKFREFISVYLR